MQCLAIHRRFSEYHRKIFTILKTTKISKNTSGRTKLLKLFSIRHPGSPALVCLQQNKQNRRNEKDSKPTICCFGIKVMKKLLDFVEHPHICLKFYKKDIIIIHNISVCGFERFKKITYYQKWMVKTFQDKQPFIRVCRIHYVDPILWLYPWHDMAKLIFFFFSNFYF